MTSRWERGPRTTLFVFVCVGALAACAGETETFEPEVATSALVAPGFCNDSAQCAEGMFCRTSAGKCGAPGTCYPLPAKGTCDASDGKVCGCDGVTYDHWCAAAEAGAQLASQMACGVSPCESNADCDDDAYCRKSSCDGEGVCRTKPQSCGDYEAPVCGCDGETYGNRCLAALGGTNAEHGGACVEEVPCKQASDCGPDGWCDAPGKSCGEGVCKPKPQACKDINKPVCGCDGVTYPNRCVASQFGTDYAYGGKCEDLCEGFEPPGCVQTGCPDGQICDTTVGCVPSSCGCDPATGDIWCTDDCGGGTCVDEKPDLCEGFEPPGCVQTGCADGFVCDTTVGCVSSYCACDPTTGSIICTDDCGGGTCVKEDPGACCDPKLEPGVNGNPFCFEGHACCPDGTWACSIGDGKTFPCGGELVQNPDGDVCEDVDLCEGFEAPGCMQSGCPDGQVCDTTVGCNPSICSCDPTSGAIICTADCGGGTCVDDKDLCEGFVPPGCSQSGCPDGQICDTTVGCNPSICSCDPTSGAIICTADCGGGTCVDEKPNQCCDPTTEPGVGDNPICFEGHACCPDGTWACSIGDGKTFPCGGGLVQDPDGHACEACCDPKDEPGANGNPFCFEGATCCADGTWGCNNGDGSTSCQATGIVCEVDLCEDFVPPGCVQSGCPDGQVCDTSVGCTPSVCACDPTTGGIICTADCGGGTCVDKTSPIFCGGFAGIPCPDGLVCVDAPGDQCSPDCGGADCGGMCVDVVGGFCGGIAGFPCPDGQTCIDDPSDKCSPECGGADCGGMCVIIPGSSGGLTQ